MVEPLDLFKVNIFNNYMHMKIWGHMFSKACGSNTNNVKPNIELVNKLIDKFINDYNNKEGE
tara:strand:- start:296 stop:481 length:186 start_codon:yes stop_codon:yes gene_type:complete